MAVPSADNLNAAPAPSNHAASTWCSEDVRERLVAFCRALIDQQAAQIIVDPQQPASGFWFGGGNLVGDDDGGLVLVGRYRNAGDSRSGTELGTRGLELTVFVSDDSGRTFRKFVSRDKASLSPPDTPVVSIEGSCLRRVAGGWELYVSTEKSGIDYPPIVADYLKRGAGVWSIDVIRASSLADLQHAPVEPFLAGSDAAHVHIKDPFLLETTSGESLGFCSHPFGWTSSGTGIIRLEEGSEASPQFDVVPRGVTWDVAMTRGTSYLKLPAPLGTAADTVGLLFYCGGECVRQHDEHQRGVQRPRGYSCEELGGAIAVPDDDFTRAVRLSDLFPLFVSPFGTGCSRYVDVLETPDAYLATWQQSQPDLSQPLVLHTLSKSTARDLLTGRP